MNAVIERTNNKLNQLQAQVIVLETQLSFAVETNNKLTEEIEKLKKKKEKNTQEDFSTPS